jgi:hypothetical protein
MMANVVHFCSNLIETENLTGIFNHSKHSWLQFQLKAYPKCPVFSLVTKQTKEEGFGMIAFGNMAQGRPVWWEKKSGRERETSVEDQERKTKHGGL